MMAEYDIEDDEPKARPTAAPASDYDIVDDAPSRPSAGVQLPTRPDLSSTATPKIDAARIVGAQRPALPMMGTTDRAMDTVKRFGRALPAELADAVVGAPGRQVADVASRLGRGEVAGAFGAASPLLLAANPITRVAMGLVGAAGAAAPMLRGEHITPEDAARIAVGAGGGLAMAGHAGAEAAPGIAENAPRLVSASGAAAGGAAGEFPNPFKMTREGFRAGADDWRTTGMVSDAARLPFLRADEAETRAPAPPLELRQRMPAPQPEPPPLLSAPPEARRDPFSPDLFSRRPALGAGETGIEGAVVPPEAPSGPSVFGQGAQVQMPPLLDRTPPRTAGPTGIEGAVIPPEPTPATSVFSHATAGGPALSRRPPRPLNGPTGIEGGVLPADVVQAVKSQPSSRAHLAPQMAEEARLTGTNPHSISNMERGRAGKAWGNAIRAPTPAERMQIESGARQSIPLGMSDFPPGTDINNLDPAMLADVLRRKGVSK